MEKMFRLLVIGITNGLRDIPVAHDKILQGQKGKRNINNTAVNVDGARASHELRKHLND